jgi:hypothetical protein
MPQRVDVADLVADWAHRIAAGDGRTPEELLRDLGVGGSLVPSFGDMRLEPAPAGIRQVHLRGGVPSLATVEVWPAAGALTLGMLDARLGARQELPRVHWDSPHLWAYDVRTEDPPGRCTVFARTSAASAPEAPVDSVLLRTEPK